DLRLVSDPGLFRNFDPGSARPGGRVVLRRDGTGRREPRVRVLMLHNRYRDPGGEDVAAHREAAMLRDHGIEVMEHEVDNETDLGAVALVAQSAWSNESFRSINALCKQFRPDVIHVHNFWMRLTPSVHAAAHEAG